MKTDYLLIFVMLKYAIFNFLTISTLWKQLSIIKIIIIIIIINHRLLVLMFSIFDRKKGVIDIINSMLNTVTECWNYIVFTVINRIEAEYYTMQNELSFLYQNLCLYCMFVYLWFSIVHYHVDLPGNISEELRACWK